MIKKGMLTGIGLGLHTNEKILEYARKMAHEANMTAQEARNLANELLAESEKSKEKLAVMVDERVRRQMDKMGLVSKEEVEELRKEVKALKKEVEKLKKK